LGTELELKFEANLSKKLEVATEGESCIKFMETETSYITG